MLKNFPKTLLLALFGFISLFFVLLFFSFSFSFFYHSGWRCVFFCLLCVFYFSRLIGFSVCVQNPGDCGSNSLFFVDFDLSKSARSLAGPLYCWLHCCCCIVDPSCVRACGYDCSAQRHTTLSQIIHIAVLVALVPCAVNAISHSVWSVLCFTADTYLCAMPASVHLRVDTPHFVGICVRIYFSIYSLVRSLGACVDCAISN